MSDLLWPGDDRTGNDGGFADAAVLDAMVTVEQAWLDALTGAAIAPADAAADLLALVSASDVALVAADAGASGTPVAPLVALLRERLAEHKAATWVHRGLTSQDVLDSALMICARDAVARIGAALRTQIAALADLALAHRETPMIARTLTQHAVPTTFGVKIATWLTGLLDSAEDLAALHYLAQFGGAVGTRAASVELAGLAGSADPLRVVDSMAADAAATLGLDAGAPWQTARAPVTRIGDALVRCADAWGHVANDVLLLGRPEIGEVTEFPGDGRGGSSTMPQKVNPVRCVLVRRWALSAPGYGAHLHVASAAAVDERPDGAWHAEWEPLQLLARHSLTAAAQMTQLCTGLQVHVERMRANLDAALPGALAERASMRAMFDTDTDTDTDSDAGATADGADAYLAAAAHVVDLVLARADTSKGAI